VQLTHVLSSHGISARIYPAAVLTKGQIPLRYPASEPARELVRELVCDLLASRSQICSELEFGLSRTISRASSELAGLRPGREVVR